MNKELKRLKKKNKEMKYNRPKKQNVKSGN